MSITTSPNHTQVVECSCKGEDRKEALHTYIDVVEFDLYPQYRVQITQDQARTVQENDPKALRKALCSNKTTEVFTQTLF